MSALGKGDQQTGTVADKAGQQQVKAQSMQIIFLEEQVSQVAPGTAQINATGNDDGQFHPRFALLFGG